ncbi:MAG: glutamine--fructose-6-phosphate transaminase (isomerizing) [Lachnospiraceae bacterium]|nr:glutamine--fructose-6-phosphate transaminase (isomerizing) [Lachnospiraceae bacterium]
MCGIVGFTGRRQAAGILLDGLGKLEYRGYDSAGMAVRDEQGTVRVIKATGKLKNLEEKTQQGASLPGCCGIGHTRWATHGEPNEKNAHPHISGAFEPERLDYSDCTVVGVHNGIIENFEELKDKLLRHGYKLYSDTDTEIAIKIVDYYYNKYKIGPIDAINRMMVRVRGSYALALMFKDHPGEIYAARKDSPMIIGIADGESFLASDVPAVLKYTRDVYYIGNHQAARILPGEVHFFDLNGDEISIPCKKITMDASAAGKNGYEHYMMKEIHEQPSTLRDTLESLMKDERIDLAGAGMDDEYLKGIRDVYIVACGSAWHVGMTAQYVIEDMAELPVRVELASEFRYRKLLLGKDSLVIVISQSGETADSLSALRIAKEMGARTLGIVNVEGSSIAREADEVLYTKAGPEIAVATTKAFTAQLMVMYAFALQLALARGKIGEEAYRKDIRELQALPDRVSYLLTQKGRIQWIASRYCAAHDAFFIGRGSDYAISMEGSLKLKEISYIHSEAYAAGELKHGTISLIEDNTLIVGVLTQKELMEKTISNMKECKARGAYLMGILSEQSAPHIEEQLDFILKIPETDSHFAGIPAVIPLQLLGYYISVSKGLDVDKPRNLAKSVTVE